MEIEIEKKFELSGHSGPIYSLCKAGEKACLFSGGSDKMIAKWNMLKESVEPMSAKLPQTPYKIAYNAQLNILIAGLSTGSLIVIDIKEKKEKRHLKFHTKGIFDIKFTEDGNYCWVAAGDGKLSVWETEDFSLVKYFEISEEKVRSIAFYDQEQYALIGSRDGMIHVINCKTLKVEFNFLAHKWAVNKVIPHPTIKNYIITGGKDAYIKVWDLYKEKLIKDIPAHNYAVYDFAFNKDKTLLASASRDKTIKIWDLETFEILKRIDYIHQKGHRYSVNALIWEHSNDILISTGDDSKIIGWNCKK